MVLPLLGGNSYQWNVALNIGDIVLENIMDQA